MPRGSAAASRANLDLAPGGDRFADKRVIVDAIRAAFEGMDNDAELREFFGLHSGRRVSARHRRRWAKAKAKKTYEAIVSSMRRGLLGDRYQGADLTKEEKSEIDAKMEKAREVAGWDGRTLVGKYLEDYESDMEYYATLGMPQDELDELAEDLKWEYLDEMIQDGYVIGEGSEEELAQQRAELIKQAKAVKKVKLHEMGSLKISGFLTIEPRKEERLYQAERSLPKNVQRTYAWSYFMGVDEGYGDFVYDLIGEDRFKIISRIPLVASFYSENGQYQEIVDEIHMVRLKWFWNVRTYIEASGEVEDHKINAFPGHVLAHIKTIRKIDPQTGFVTPDLADCYIEKYLDYNEALIMANVWHPEGLHGTTVGEYKKEIYDVYPGGYQDHLPYWDWAGEPRYIQTSISSKTLKIDAPWWNFEYPVFGADYALTAEAIGSVFPRRKTLVWAKGLRRLPNFEWEWYDKWGTMAWVKRDKWGGEDAIRQALEYYPDGDIPPLDPPPERVRFIAKFSGEILAEIDN